MAEMRRIMIIFFSVGGTFIFYTWMKSRRRSGLMAQQYDYNKTKDLIYIDKATMVEMNLTWQELE